MKTAGVVLGSLLLAMGCAGADPPAASPAAQRADEPGSTRASRELVTAREEARAIEAPRPPAAPPAPRPLLDVHPIDADEGEDGRGATVAATRAIAFDLDAARFPARARDPELHVGELVLRHYTYPSPGLLRFVAADAATLPVGAPVWVEHRGEPDHRVPVADALVLP